MVDLSYKAVSNNRRSLWIRLLNGYYLHPWNFIFPPLKEIFSKHCAGNTFIRVAVGLKFILAHIKWLLTLKGNFFSYFQYQAHFRVLINDGLYLNPSQPWMSHHLLMLRSGAAATCHTGTSPNPVISHTASRNFTPWSGEVMIYRDTA